MFQIVKIPNPVLTTPGKRVEKIDKKVLAFIEGMKKTLLAANNPKGVGLAAPQVGRGVRIFMTKPSPKTPFTVFINPEILWASEEKTTGVPERDKKFEGCLSVSNVWGIVHRHQSIKVSYQTPDGKTHTKMFKGFLATIIQHEIDHIDGILFTKRALEQKEKLYKITGLDKEGNDVFEEIEV
jgi:peptide deformylase